MSGFQHASNAYEQATPTWRLSVSWITSDIETPRFVDVTFPDGRTERYYRRAA